MSIREYDSDAASAWADERGRKAMELRRALDPAGYCLNGPWEPDEGEQDGCEQAD